MSLVNNRNICIMRMGFSSRGHKEAIAIYDKNGKYI